MPRVINNNYEWQMQLDLPIDGGTLLGLASFAAAVIFQSAMLKRSVEVITTRMDKIEENMAKITQLLISNEGLTQRITALTDRVRHIEEVAMTLHTAATSGGMQRRTRKPSS